MQNISILAFPVQDLTVARYLAAANIDFIAIDLNRIQNMLSETFLSDIRNWIEGPQLIGYGLESDLDHYIQLNLLDGKICDISSTTIQIQLKDQILDFEKFDKLNPTNPFTWIEVKASEVLGIYDFEEIEATLLSLGVEL
jgi:hypothetical protein